MDASFPHLAPRHQHGPSLFSRQCIQCDEEAPTCNCVADENCVLVPRTCSQCPTIQCNKKPSSGGNGINPGVIAGPVVAILVIASLCLFWYLRRKKRRDLARLEELAARARKAESAGFHLSQPSSPVPGSARTARSNPSNRQSAQLSTNSDTNASGTGTTGHRQYRRSQRSPLLNNGNLPNTAGLYPDRNAQGNPFADDASGVTASSDGSGVEGGQAIPIMMAVSSGSAPNDAARTLNEARENLWKGGPPQRPARAPGLDLRLNNQLEGSLGSGHLTAPSPGGASQSRDSFQSGNSGAPSFSSGYTSDLHMDAPKIFTSKHVQMGRFQQAEVVQFGAKPAMMEDLGQNSKLSPAMVALPGTGSSTANSGNVSPYSPNNTGNYRTLTPSSASASHSGRYDGDTEEVYSPDGSSNLPPGVSPTDLRFSMGSLAYRDSISSMGTDRYIARPDSSAYPVTSHSEPRAGAIPPPRAPFAGQARESVMSDRSGRSEADSVLSGFPMIPPGERASSASISLPGFPQSTSAATLMTLQRPDIQASPSSRSINTGEPSRPPPAYRPPGNIGSGHGGVPEPKSRPQTSASVADSFLGTFPFVPPNQGDMPEPPTGKVPETAFPTTGTRGRALTGESSLTGKSGGNTAGRVGGGVRNTTMSGVSEGLGAFEFKFDRDEAPPVPGRRE